MTDCRVVRTRIKFCGMRREEDLRLAVRLGVDAIGFVCVPGLPRCVDLPVVAPLRRQLPPFVACVALLRNPTRAVVETVMEVLKPDLLQFHGEEPAEFCRQFGVPYLKAIAMGAAPPHPELLASYSDASALLLDGHRPGELGGQGKAFNWRGSGLDVAQPLILAGGLVPENVAEAIVQFRPYAVDVSSGVEADPRAAPTIKDSGKMAAFIVAVRRADAAHADLQDR